MNLDDYYSTIQILKSNLAWIQQRCQNPIKIDQLPININKLVSIFDGFQSVLD